MAAVIAAHTGTPMENYSDTNLTLLIKQGSEQAFNELTLRYLQLIRGKAARYKTDDTDLDDFIQEGLLSLLYAAKSYDEKEGASFKTYAGICISNRFASIIRGANRKKDIPSKMLISIDSGIYLEEDAVSPEQKLIDNEDYRNFLKHVKNTLSPLEYKVLTYYLGGSSYGEIADILDLSYKAVDNALQRIRKKLKKG